MANAINVALSHARAGAALVGSAREPAAAFAASLAGGGAPRGFSSRRLREADATRAAALVIGGDATQRRFCATFLETLGLSITVAEDFCDGVRALASEAPRLVILDARATGFEPAAWSRIVDACEVRPKVFVVVDPADDRVNGAMAELAFDGFLPRPIRSLDLVRAAELAAR